MPKELKIVEETMGEHAHVRYEHFEAHGYFVSMIGLGEDIVRTYICNQEEEDERYDDCRVSRNED